MYPFDYLDPLQPVYLNVDFARSQSVGGEMQVSKTFFEDHRITAGAEVRADVELAQKNFDRDPLAIYLDSSESASFFGIYAQDEFQIRNNLILNTGVRYDRYSTFGDTVNPRVALIYRPWEPTTFKFLYGQAFRAPNAYEHFYEGFDFKLNPSLGAETIRSYELILEQRLSQSWNASASLYLNDIKNLIGLQQDPADSLFFFDNVESVRAMGAEVEATAQWASGLRGSASYSYSHTEDSATGLRLSNSPEHMGKLGLSVPLWRDKVFASLELQGMTRRDTVRAGGVSGFWLANATLFSRELVEGLEVSASLHNMFDRRYQDPASADFTQNAIQRDGRSFRVKMTYRF